MNYKTCFTIAYGVVIFLFVSGVFYHLGVVSHPHYKPITVKYEHISKSLLKDMQNSGIRVTPEQWEALHKSMIERK